MKDEDIITYEDIFSYKDSNGETPETFIAYQYILKCDFCGIEDGGSNSSYFVIEFHRNKSRLGFCTNCLRKVFGKVLNAESKDEK